MLNSFILIFTLLSVPALAQSLPPADSSTNYPDDPRAEARKFVAQETRAYYAIVTKKLNALTDAEYSALQVCPNGFKGTRSELNDKIASLQVNPVDVMPGQEKATPASNQDGWINLTPGLDLSGKVSRPTKVVTIQMQAFVNLGRSDIRNVALTEKLLDFVCESTQNKEKITHAQAYRLYHDLILKGIE